MEESIEEEVRLNLSNEKEYKKYKQGYLHVGITVSFDMGWNKCSSGNRYDSLSGHALMIAYLSKNIVVAIVSSKMSRRK